MCSLRVFLLSDRRSDGMTPPSRLGANPGRDAIELKLLSPLSRGQNEISYTALDSELPMISRELQIQEKSRSRGKICRSGVNIMDLAITFGTLVIALALSLMLTLMTEEILLRGLIRLVDSRPSSTTALARTDET